MIDWVLAGNTNTYTVVDQKIDPVFIASKIRFIPYSDHFRTVCMRVDILGCPWQEGVVSYSMPQGERRSGEPDLRDNSYDGVEEGGWLSGGLGQLVDGHKGLDDFHMDVFGHGKGYEWVGWRNDSTSGRPVEIVFEFETLRNFSAMYLHTNNLYSKDVQVFSLAKVYLSVGGKLFSGEPIHAPYMPDVIIENARNVTIKLHHTIGRFLKLQLYFASRWILVSEVSFDSVIVPGNITEEIYDNNLGSPIDPGKDVPLQRDAVHTTPGKDDTKKNEDNGNNNQGSGITLGGDRGGTKEPESRHLIGLLIALTSVILLLMVAIVFIIYRSRKTKTSHHNSSDQFNAEKNELQLRGKMNSNGHVYGQVSMEEPEKNVVYHEPFANQINMYGFQSNPQIKRNVQTPEYTDVPDIVQEYAVPLVNAPIGGSQGVHTNVPPGTPMRTLPPLHNFFPKPPPVPPPPEKYYAATEIVQKVPPVPLSPPPSVPPSLGASSSSSSYGQLMSLPALGEDDDQDSDVTLHDFPRRDLKYSSKLGVGVFGEVHLFEMLRTPNWVRSNSCKYVAVKVLRKGSPDNLREEFQKEMEELLPLRNENISMVLGACLEIEPLLLVMEFSEFGDLYQFLQNHVAESANLPNKTDVLSYGTLIYMATQVASGMKYLEYHDFILHDLATRNCIVGQDYAIKIADLGIGQSLYPADYFEIPGRGALPIRWMAWESIVMTKYSMKSIVWTFAVTLWEILTFSREQPHEDLTDEKVLENAQYFDKGTIKQLRLPQPINCHKEIYDLMCECWQKKENDRPSFKEIHMFLQRKNLGYKHNIMKS